MEPEKTNMHEIKAKVDRLEEVVEDSLETQKETNERLGELVTLMRIREEREDRQQETNKDHAKKLDAHDGRLTSIEMERATEKHSRDFLSKYWPWMMVGCVLATGLVAAAVSGLGRNLVG